jgi:hypothetical protein
MTKTFEEIQDLMPRNTLTIMASVLAATDFFMLMCSLTESIKTPLWMFAMTSILFAAIIVFCFLAKTRVSVEDGTIYIRFIRGYTVPFEDIIDYKIGDLDTMRNYSGWGIRKVVFKNLIGIGYERGISLKLTGRRVITISLSDPEKFAGLLPKPRE